MNFMIKKIALYVEKGYKRNSNPKIYLMEKLQKKKI